ncbi:MAG: hypothetical protein PF484_08230 [Bacteroidales bacterium]|nr:hypothetical protein [Bacteroidales bacterium]
MRINLRTISLLILCLIMFFSCTNKIYKRERDIGNDIQKIHGRVFLVKNNDSCINMTNSDTKRFLERVNFIEQKENSCYHYYVLLSLVSNADQTEGVFRVFGYDYWGNRCDYAFHCLKSEKQIYINNTGYNINNDKVKADLDAFFINTSTNYKENEKEAIILNYSEGRMLLRFPYFL